MRGHKLDHLASNSTTAVADEARVNPVLATTVVIEFKAKLSDLYPCTVVILHLGCSFLSWHSVHEF